MNYCLESKPWSMHCWGGTPSVCMSHCPTRFKQQKKDSTGEKAALALISIPQGVCIVLLDKHHIKRPRHNVGSKWESTEKQEEFSKAMGKMKGFAKQ